MHFEVYGDMRFERRERDDVTISLPTLKTIKINGAHHEQEIACQTTRGRQLFNDDEFRHWSSISL